MIAVIQAGDVVLHKPTQEEWYILGVNQAQNKVCVAGWPPTIAELNDCEWIKSTGNLTDNEIVYRNKKFGSDWD